MLVERQQGADGLGAQGVHQDGGRGPVAREGLVRGQSIRFGVSRARRDQLGPRLLLRLADHQGLRLGQRIGPQRRVALAVVHGGVGGVAHDHELGRNHHRALMDLLEEGVLAVGAGLAEDDRAGGGVDGRAVALHPLAVRFHLQLLQEGRQAAQAVGIGRHGARVPAHALDVINLRQRQQHRGVLLQVRRQEMLVHGPGAVQHALEHVPAQRHGDRQADRRPQRIATPDPVAETEGPAAAPGLGLVRRGGDADQMARQAFGRQRFRQPGLGQLGIGQRFLRREGLGHDHDEGRLRLQTAQRLGHLARIDIGDEAQVDGWLQWAQRVPQQARAQVRAADTDMDDRRERLARPAGLGARADVGREPGHGVAGGGHLLRHRLAQRVEVGVSRGAQGRVQHRAPLGVVHHLAAEQGCPTPLDVAGPRQIQRRLEPLGAPRLFGQVQIQARGLHPHPLDPPGVRGELMEDAGP